MTDGKGNGRSTGTVQPSTEISIVEARRQKPGRWLLFGVTRRNALDEPTHGHLLFSDAREGAVTRRMSGLFGAQSGNYSGLAILYSPAAAAINGPEQA